MRARTTIHGAALLILTALAACRTVEDDLRELKAELVDLEHEVPQEAPLWVSEGPNAFETFIEDYSLRVPDFIYNHLAQKLSKMRESDLRAQSRGALPVAECLEQPRTCRGRLWTIRGVVASLDPQPVADRGLGIETAYSGVLFMDGQPVLFHVMEKPDVMRVGEDTGELTGVFVKIFRYKSRNGRDVFAPFLMGRRLGKYY